MSMPSPDYARVTGHPSVTKMRPTGFPIGLNLLLEEGLYPAFTLHPPTNQGLAVSPGPDCCPLSY
jgi:hypothetical protein